VEQVRETLRLGHLRGIRVGLNWSVLVIFLLITFGLAAERFPVLYPERSTAAYLVAGLVAGLVFLVSLLAHELSHALVARRNDVDVDGITLWMLGGVANLRGRARTAGAELRISGVGPLVSLTLAVVFFLVLLGVEAAGVTGLPIGVLRWLALINLVLAVFNLFPAAPLDGGRVLTAFLWKRRGDRQSAGITAARAGRAFGLGLVGVGFLLLVSGRGGVWLMLIGGFLAIVASAEERQLQVERVLGDVRVRDAMTSGPTTAPADVSVADFLEDYVLRHRFSSFPLVTDDGRPVGLVTLNRVKQVPRDRRADVPVRDVACSGQDLVQVAPEDALSDVLGRLGSCADGRAVVVEGGRVVGILSPSDISRQLQVIDLRTNAGMPYDPVRS
jgi:Zn-dependent protease